VYKEVFYGRSGNAEIKRAGLQLFSHFIIVYFYKRQIQIKVSITVRS